MNIVNLSEVDIEESAVNIPKLTTSSFELRNNYYVATDGEKFNYYTIKVKTEVGSSGLIHFEKSPPVLLEGLAIVNKKVYKVSLGDLLRRIIRKSNEISIEALNGTDSNTSTEQSGTDVSAITIDDNSTNSIRNQDESGTSSKITVEEHQVIDASWQDQIGALLHTLHKEEGFFEEEWELSDTPQS